MIIPTQFCFLFFTISLVEVLPGTDGYVLRCRIFFTVLCRCESCIKNARDRKRVDVLEVKFLMMICGVMQADNAQKYESDCSLNESASQSVLKWFRYTKRASKGSE